MCDLPELDKPEIKDARRFGGGLEEEAREPAGWVSLGKRLRKSSVPCFGIDPNWEDYSEEVRKKIARAPRVFYPGPVFQQVIAASGKKTFPGNYYHFLGNKIAQTNLFELLDIPHPRTGIYYGRNRQLMVEHDFEYPFIGKTPVGSSQGLGVFLIRGPEELSKYIESHNPAYVQEYLRIERDLRAVVIGGRVVHAYWRIHKQGEFRNNVSRGGRISFENIPAAALEFARSTALRCRFGEAGLDICEHNDGYMVLEANMVYGVEGFKEQGMDIHEILAHLVDKGAI